MNNVGGLLGVNEGSITASYAIGLVHGGYGVDRVGGLVGDNRGGSGSILASYASGNVDGGVGNDNVGGLVGYNSNSITASYAVGSANGDAGEDYVGGLLGYNLSGSITASYAVGSTNGDAGDDNVGGLVGYNAGNIVKSYGFGEAINGTSNTHGNPPSECGFTGRELCTASNLTLGLANDGGNQWNSAGSNTLNAWVFPSIENPAPGPRLRYANYAGTAIGSMRFLYKHL